MLTRLLATAAAGVLAASLATGALAQGNSENAPGHDPGGPGAAEFAPGHLKDDGESAAAFAPGQLKDEGESARDFAPGQRMHDEDDDEDDDDDDV